jgi:hypothetical protein
MDAKRLDAVGKSWMSLLRCPGRGSRSNRGEELRAGDVDSRGLRGEDALGAADVGTTGDYLGSADREGIRCPELARIAELSVNRSDIGVEQCREPRLRGSDCELQLRPQGLRFGEEALGARTSGRW